MAAHLPYLAYLHWLPRGDGATPWGPVFLALVVCNTVGAAFLRRARASSIAVGLFAAGLGAGAGWLAYVLLLGALGVPEV